MYFAGNNNNPDIIHLGHATHNDSILQLLKLNLAHDKPSAQSGTHPQKEINLIRLVSTHQKARENKARQEPEMKVTVNDLRNRDKKEKNRVIYIF